MGLHETDYVPVASPYLSLTSKPPYVPEILICTYCFSVFHAPSLPLPPSLPLTLSFSHNTLTFMQNLGLVCLQSITLILEDDFNKQVTLSRGGQILTSPNQGFTLNGKKQSSEDIIMDNTHNLRGPFSLLVVDRTFTGCLCHFTKNTGGHSVAYFSQVV